MSGEHQAGEKGVDVHAQASPHDFGRAGRLVGRLLDLAQERRDPLIEPPAFVGEVERPGRSMKQACADWRGHRIVENEGPARVSPNDLAAAFSKALERTVSLNLAPRDGWEATFRAQGMTNPTPRARMVDGFNEGWIEFSDGGANARRGRISINQAIGALVANTPAHTAEA